MSSQQEQSPGSEELDQMGDSQEMEDLSEEQSKSTPNFQIAATISD